jgi:hypothetical protein
MKFQVFDFEEHREPSRTGQVPQGTNVKNKGRKRHCQGMHSPENYNRLLL